MKSKNKTRWGNMQTVRVERDMFFTSPLEGEDVRRTDEGEVLKSLLTPPHPAFGHPLPQGARRSMFGFTPIELLAASKPESTNLTKQFLSGGDPRQRHSGMTPNLMGFTLRPSSSRSVSMRDIGAAPRGFTLIELLVVVLIIGILAAVALPMYQKAVLKSRFSALMPLAKALAESNEVYYLEHGNYAENPQELTVQGQGNYPDGTSVLMYSNEADLSFVRTANASIPNARYVVYQKHSTNFPDTTWCEASDEQAEAVCVALGGVLPEGLEGNSGADENWKAYLLGGQARPGDTFASGDDNGGDEPGTNTEPQTPTKPTCGGVEQPDDIPPTESNPATGTATCVNGQWKYTWTGGNVYRGDQQSCSGTSAYACAGSTFSGFMANCYGEAANACAGSTFSERETYCWGDAANACTGSTFSGEISQCYGEAANACAGSTFSGGGADCEGDTANGCAGSTFSGESSTCRGAAVNACADSTFSGKKSYCWGGAANACAGSTFQAGAYCNAYYSGGCDGAKYGADPTGQRTGIGSCSGSYCPTGVPLRGSWNATNGSFDYTWKGGYCNPEYMVSGACPAGSPKQGGGCWDGNGKQTSC